MKLFKRMIGQMIFMFWVAVTILPTTSFAVIQTVDEHIITDSENEYHRRVYTYDFGIDSKGDIHIIYLKPVAGQDNVGTNVYLRRISGQWQEPVVLTNDGLFPTASTRLIIGEDDVVHVCYIQHQSDGNGGAFDPDHDRYLAYHKIVNGVVGQRQVVSPGAWHSAMQLDEQGRALFLRQDADWQSADASKFAIFTTTDETQWSRRLLNLSVNLRKLKSFIYADGKYHILYCDNAQTKGVIVGAGSTDTKTGTFYDLRYASSNDGDQWNISIVDDSFTLYKDEFWTALALDGGTPLVAMYKYAEYGGQYNTGTSALLAKSSGNDWIKKNITPADYPATREGMGVGIAVRGPGDYYGVWDFSPENTFDDNFRGERGNIAVAHNGADGSWSEKWQLAPFSAEGEVKVRIKGDKMYVLALGDFVDAKLYFWEIDLDELSGSSVTPPSNPPGSGGNTSALPAIFMLLQ